MTNDNPSTALEHVPAPAPPMMSFEVIERQAEALAASSIVPSQYRKKPGDIIAAALMGQDFGWTPSVSMRMIHVVEGKPTLSAEAMAALVRRAGHSLSGESTTTAATAVGRRGDNGDTITVTFTMEEADTAGLAKKDNWRKYPKAMLWARAVSMLCRQLFPDVLLGYAYTPDDFDGQVVLSGEVIPDDADLVDVDRALGLFDRLPDDAKGKLEAWARSSQEKNGDDPLPISALGDMAWALAVKVDDQIQKAAIKYLEPFPIDDDDQDDGDDDDDGIVDAEIVDDDQDHDDDGEETDRGDPRNWAEETVQSLAEEIWPDVAGPERRTRLGREAVYVTNNSKRRTLKSMTEVEAHQFLDRLEAIRDGDVEDDAT